MDATLWREVVDGIRVSTGSALATLFARERGEQLRLVAACGDTASTENSEHVEAYHLAVARVAVRRSLSLYVGGAGESASGEGAEADDWGEVGTLRPEHIQSVAAVPLRSRRGIRGVLVASFREVQRFDAAHRGLVEALARQAEIWLRYGHQAETQDRRRQRELEDLQAVDREIMGSLDLDHVLQTILERAAHHVRAVDGMVALINPATGELEARAVVGRDTERRLNWRAVPNEASGITQRAFATRRPVREADLRTSPRWRGIHHPEASPTVSELAVPVVDAGAAIGVIDFESAQAGAFGEADEDFLVTLAGQAVLAIKNAAMYERAQRLAAERQTLIDIGKEITSQLDPAQTFALILQKAIDITQATAGTLHLVDRQRGDLWVVAELGGRDPEQRQRQAFGDGVVGHVARSGRLIKVDDVTAPPWAEIYIPFIAGIRSELAVPLRAAGDVRGVINVESTTPFRFTTRDESMLMALADLAVIAVENAERYQQAEVRGKRLEALHQVDERIIAQLENPEQVIHEVVASAVDLAGADAADLYLLNGDRVSRVFSSRVEPGANERSFSRRDAVGAGIAPPGLVAYVATGGTGYCTQDDAQSDPRYASEVSQMHSAAAVPLLMTNLSGEYAAGVLQIESRAPYAFQAEHLELLNLLAGQAVIAIQKGNAYAHAAREVRRFVRLYETGQQLGEIVAEDQMDRAYEVVVKMAEEPGIARQVVIRRFDSERQELVVVRAVAGHPIAASNIRLDEHAAGVFALHTRPLVIADSKNPHPDAAHVSCLWSEQERSVVIAPIKFKSHFYGTLTLSHEEARHFEQVTDPDIQLFGGLAHQLALTFDRVEAVRAQQDAERRAAESEALSDVGQLAVDLAHQLDNNLGLVRSYVDDVRSEIVESAINSQLAEDALNDIVDVVEKVLSLRDELLDGVARVIRDEPDTSGHITVSVEELLDTTLLSFPERPSNIHVRKEIERGAEAIYAIHPHQIERILSNLFANAIQAMPLGGDVVLRARGADTSVVIEVADSGPGIPPNHLTRIFHPFYSTKGSGNWGVGLWSASLSARRNAGELTVESTLGKGSTFRFRLPKERPRQ